MSSQRVRQVSDRAMCESLEGRRLLSASIPDGFIWAESIEVDSATATPILSEELIADVDYLAVVSGQILVSTAGAHLGGHIADAEYHKHPRLGWNDLTTIPGDTTDMGVRDQSGRLGHWGAREDDGVYGQAFTPSNTDPLGLYYNDVAGYYGDNSGAFTVDLYEQVLLSDFEAWSTSHPTNDVSAIASETLFVEMEDGTSAASVSLNVSLLSGIGAADIGMIVWKVEGGAVVGADSGDFAGGSYPSFDLSEAGVAYTVTVWVDGDGDSILDGSEDSLTAQVQIVRLDELYVLDDFSDAELSVATSTLTPEFYFAEDAATNQVPLFIDARGAPETPEAGINVLWNIAGPAGGVSGGTTSGTFAADVWLTLTPPKADCVYKVTIGFDDNANGTLEAGEVSRTMDVIPVLVETAVVKTTITLMETNDITSNVYAGGSKTPTSYDFQVRFQGQTNADWVTYRSQAAATTTETARVAGFFENRTKIVLDGQDFESPPHTAGGTAAVEVQFPDLITIKSDTAVRSAMDASWTSTKNYYNATVMREEGFYISLDTASGNYVVQTAYFGDDFPSDWSNGAAELHKAAGPSFASTSPGDSIASPTPANSVQYVVAWFHTHPPNTFGPTGFPPGTQFSVGPSTADGVFADTIDLPGFAYDYASPTTFGHNVNDPGDIYDIQADGLNRRATP